VNTRAWTAARQLAAAIGDVLTAGRSWRRPSNQHPDWCARDHRCTAARLPGGEHRSDPSVWRTAYGTIIATRTGTNAGRTTLEVRTDVRLAGDVRTARRQASHLAVGIDLTVRAVLAEALTVPAAATPSGQRHGDVPAVRPAPWPRSALPSRPPVLPVREGAR